MWLFFCWFQQLTENSVYDKSLDEHLSGKVEMRTPSPPPIDQSKLLDKRLSHQFTVGSTLNLNGLKKTNEPESRYTIIVSSLSTLSRT